MSETLWNFGSRSLLCFSRIRKQAGIHTQDSHVFVSCRFLFLDSSLFVCFVCCYGYYDVKQRRKILAMHAHVCYRKGWVFQTQCHKSCPNDFSLNCLFCLFLLFRSPLGDREFFRTLKRYSRYERMVIIFESHNLPF